MTLGLEEFVALNDELAALVRAGIPLERGLLATTGGDRGRLGQIARDLGARLEAGEALPEALDRACAGMPAVYRAAVEAGFRSGRLADALQGLARVGTAVLEARRTIALAFFYPLLVLAVAYALLVGFLVFIVPRFLATAGSLRISAGMLPGLERLGASAPIWGPVAPVVVLGLIAAWWWSGWARAGGGVATRLPWVGRIIADYRAANFVDLLGHLIEHAVPLDQALRLAGDAAGDPTLRVEARRLADKMAAGEAVPAPTTGDWSLPPLVAWMLSTGDRQGSLAVGLRQLAATYRRRADRRGRVVPRLPPGPADPRRRRRGGAGVRRLPVHPAPAPLGRPGDTRKQLTWHTDPTPETSARCPVSATRRPTAGGEPRRAR